VTASPDPLAEHEQLAEPRAFIGRRAFLIGGSALLGYGLTGCVPRSRTGKLGDPVVLNILDVAGQEQVAKGITDAYAALHPDRVSSIAYETATAPEMPGKIRAQQAAGAVSISMVLTGSDGLSAGIEQGIWMPILPQHSDVFPNLSSRTVNPQAQDLAQGFGILNFYGNFGPFFTYDPNRLASTPSTTEDLLAWARANPNRLLYARPANSGPGRAWLQGLPYLLGEPSSRQPDTWSSVWSYLQELGRYIEYYPSGTATTFTELAQGARSAVASTMGWDMNVRLLGTVPRTFKAFHLAGEHLIADGQYACVPKGIDPAVVPLVLDLIAFMLQPSQQARAFDIAYFYPGPAMKGVTPAQTPAKSRDALRSVQRPEFESIIPPAPTALPVELPLDARSLVRAFDLWDAKVGAGKLR